MKWNDREVEAPPEGTQILIFSPAYPEGDSMRFRTMDSQFFKLVTEATHWAQLEAPNT
jgi:hypothetical protein